MTYKNNLCLLLILSYSCATKSTSRYGSELHKDILIQATHIPENPIFQSRWRYDNNERNTSAAYDLWDKAGFHLFEWPGNITQMDPEFPLVRWGYTRSKYVQSPCEVERGMELATYAHKYLHLTWGANRLTRSYCNPLRVKRKDLPQEERFRKDYEIVAVDFDFVFDALLVVTQQGYIIRVADIEITYRRAVKIAPNGYRGNLTTDVAKGITLPVNRIVTQKCCSKSVGFCTHGDTVLAFKESSYLSIIFISYDGGKTFKELQLKLPQEARFLHFVLFYPTWKRILALHGTASNGYLNEFSSYNGSLIKSGNKEELNVTISGYIQSSRINNEKSFIMWDECRVWYGQPSNNEFLLTPATFYIHNSIRKEIGEAKIPVPSGGNLDDIPHVIRSSHCHFGKDSAVSFGDEGKIGILDKNNMFFYGVDLKEIDRFPLVALATDMTLLLPQKKKSICPCFDRNNRPKLLYPPRYLRLPEASMGMMDENYGKRLGMRIVKKTLFPSDFMAPFWEENLVTLPAHYEHLAISKCKTSSLSIDGSLSQKVKTYRLSWKQHISLTLTFQSSLNAPNQLQYEPRDLSLIVDIQPKLLSYSPTGPERFWFKYGINITLKTAYYDIFQNDEEMFYMNFYTLKSLRCVHQPQYPLWIQIDHSFSSASVNSNNAKQDPPPPVSIPENEDSSGILRIHHCPHQKEIDSRTTGVCSGTGTTLADAQITS